MPFFELSDTELAEIKKLFEMMSKRDRELIISYIKGMIAARETGGSHE